MPGIMEIMQMCRLCLVKDQVNISIFDEKEDLRQIFLKITTCLPVKVEKDDKLPKKICDGCSYKLELLYQFVNTSVNAEKQLLTWLGETKKSSKSQEHPSVEAVVLKQEIVEPPEVMIVDTAQSSQNYVLQEENLPYESFEYEPSVDVSAAAALAEVDEHEMPSKRPRLAPSATVVSQGGEESDDDNGVEERIAKIENESEPDEDSVDAQQPQFISVASTSVSDQPGPSGVQKPVDPTYLDPLTGVYANYECEICMNIFPSKQEFEKHHQHNGSHFTCCRCRAVFDDEDQLFDHYDEHKAETIVIEDDGMETMNLDYSENDEAVMNIPTRGESGNSELLYILDDSQCVNEVVIEEDSEEATATAEKPEKPDGFAIVQVDHRYMIPSVFKGQLQTKRRYKRKDLVAGEEEEQQQPKDSENLLLPMRNQPSTSGNTFRARFTPKRRHEVPDFSATNYVVLNPTEEVDIMHLKCLRCEQLFINKFVFFRHIEKGKCYVNSCDVCSATFDKNSEFYDHYLVEHTDRAICNFCFRTFMYEKNVKEHMMRHLDQFRHRCEECDKGFYTVREYRNHYKNRHMGIRHKCEICGRSFADEYYFKRHIATHAKAVKTTPTTAATAGFL